MEEDISTLTLNETKTFVSQLLNRTLRHQATPQNKNVIISGQVKQLSIVLPLNKFRRSALELTESNCKPAAREKQTTLLSPQGHVFYAVY